VLNHVALLTALSDRPGRHVVTSNALQRTFRIEFDGLTGTAFLIDAGGRRYLVTAAHILEGTKPLQDVTIFVRNGDDWLPLVCFHLGKMEPPIDVAVLAPRVPFGPPPESHLQTGGGALLGSDCYFLGFPWGLATQSGSLNGNYPIPLVKKALCSGFRHGDDGKTNGYYLDGINNPGFSGGPVLDAKSDPPRVFAIIAGYRTATSEVVNKMGEETGLFYEYNTGIVIASDIRFALAIIESAQRPVG